ncbi:MAG: Hsp20/alpha crystallin family protein [Lachnospiraceae bacterium]|nr:Hsp20/alpha crystallin family protein [Lachnospiraceae bacterium]MDE6627700.1 Hsp20/alpha crystallin family protein [Lachnospiraceae bacterium]
MLVPSIFSNDLFDNFFNDTYRPSEHFIHSANSRDLMNTDIKEFEDKYELGIELPGYQKEDVTASLKEGYLTIEAERHADKETKEGKYIRKECFTGKCQRSFYVGEQVTQADIHAAFNNGILSITVPKIKEQPKVEENHYIAIE